MNQLKKIKKCGALLLGLAKSIYYSAASSVLLSVERLARWLLDGFK